MKFASLSYFEDEALTKKLDINNISLGRGAKLNEVRRKVFWIYNLGNARLLKLRVVSTDRRLKVVQAPTELAPQKKASVTVEFKVDEPKNLACKLEVVGVYEE